MSEAAGRSGHPSPEESKWDERFFELARFISNWSEDVRLKVGAVIADDAHVVRSTGYNGLPRGVSAAIDSRHSNELLEKDHWYEHAERNAIYNAARTGIPIAGCTIYTTVFPCSVCMRAIIQSGLTMLVTTMPPAPDNGSFEKYRRSFEVATEMAAEAGVSIRFLG